MSSRQQQTYLFWPYRPSAGREPSLKLSTATVDSFALQNLAECGHAPLLNSTRTYPLTLAY